MNFRSFISKFSVQDWIFMIFSILWVSIVMLDYLNKQVIYVPSITHFKFLKLFTFFIILGAVVSASYTRTGFFKRFRSIPINGMVILFIFLLAICAITLAYNQYWKAPLDFSNYVHLIAKGLFTLGCSFLLILATYSSGNIIRSKILENESRGFTFVLLDICIGFVLYTFIMMILGTFALLNQVILLSVLSILILINYKSSFWLIKQSFWVPIKRPNDLNFWGSMIAFATLIYVVLNYFYTQAPYPLGFDARNYYVNIAKLIGESEALVAGFQPYAWSLVMSTGYVAFNSPEVTLFISALGGLLSLFAIYHFCQHYMKLSSNLSFVVVILYLLTPTVTNHFMIEFKIDLALLFFQMVTITFLFWWMFDDHGISEKRKSLLQSRRDVSSISIIGLLLGYCLSIKVLSVFLIFGIFAGVWWYNKDTFGVIGFCASSFGFILIAGLDRLSGLRDYHLSPTATGITLLIFGIVCLGYSFYKSKNMFLSSMKILVLCGTLALLTFSPWIYKNYHFTKSTSFINLFIGEKPRPNLNLNLIDENYQKFLEENK